MQFLILTCNTGEGHNSAARSIKQYFESRGDSCDIRDALAYWSEENSKLISRSHVFLYRNFPKLFGLGYRYEENHMPKKGDPSIMYELVIHGCDSLYEELQTTRYDAVFCTHVFPAMMMTELRRRHHLNLKTYFVSTDYTCSPGTSQSVLDAYFTAHENLADEFVSCGIPAERLVASGIPVAEKFFEKTPAATAKKHLGIPADGRMLLLMCGSMGCGPIKELTEELTDLIPADTYLFVICGSNRRLYKSLTKYPLPNNVRIKGFTSRVPLYMDAADLILTKPGGLSCTEAAAKALPMVFINAVPGCETRNREFFVKNGYAKTGDTVAALCDLVFEFFNNPEAMARMSDKLKADFSVPATHRIYDYVSEDLVLNYDRL